MNWLAGEDIAAMKIVNEMPMLEMFIMLNKKIIDTEKQIAKAKKGQR